MKKQLSTETTMVVPVLARLSRSLAVFTLLLLTFPMLRARPALAEHRSLYVDAPLPSGAQQYTVTDLGTLPECPLSYAQGINASGQVVGSSSASAYYPRAFLWSDGVMSDLGTLPGDNLSEARGINDSGQVVGFSFYGGPAHAFLWSDGLMSDLGTLPGDNLSEGTGINASGQVVGYSAGPCPAHAFLWS